MSLLTICQNAADEVQITRPASIIGNNSDDAKRLLRYANKIGTSVMKSFPWQDLRDEKTFTSVATETQTSILPSDFDRIVPETFWNRTDKVLISGPASPVQWQGLKATDYNDTARPKFAYRGGNILILPTMTAGKTLAFEWISENWAQSSGGDGKSAFDTDTDTGVLSEELLTRGVIVEWLMAEGQPWEAAFASFREYFNDLTDNEQADADILVAADIFGGGRHFTGAPPVNGDSSAI